LIFSDRNNCEQTLRRQIIEEVESLATYLHASRLTGNGDRRGAPVL
jgi:hypothetical protein